MGRISAIPAPDGPADRVAETVIMLALMLARSSGEGASTSTIAGKTIGLVGLDDAARAVVVRAVRGFGMRVLVHASALDRTLVERLGAECSPSVDHLLATSDIVSLHGRSGGATFIDAHRLNQMKPDACLINATDGGLMDEQALLHALWFETIGGAGIAVPEDTLDRPNDLRASDRAIVLSRRAELPDVAPSLAVVGGRSAMDNVIPLFHGRRHA